MKKQRALGEGIIAFTSEKYAECMKNTHESMK